MLKSGGKATVAVLGFLASILIGCGGGTVRNESAAPRSAEAPDHKANVATGPIDEKVLSDHGFIQLWTKQPTEGPFHDVYLLSEGIFAVVRPAPGSSFYRLIRYSRDDGLPLWIYEIPEPLSFPPVAYRYPGVQIGKTDELYVLQKDTIICLTLRDGAELWKVPLPFSVSSPPIVDEKQYYIGSLDRKIYALQKDKPFPHWPFITGGEVRAQGSLGPAGQIYFASTDSSVYRLEPTGYVPMKSWSFKTGGRITGKTIFFSRWVLFGSTDYKLYSLEVDGTLNWDFPVESPIYGTPVAVSLRPNKEVVFCVSRDERQGEEKNLLWAVEARTGKELWHKENYEKLVTVGKAAAYILTDAKAGPPRRIVAVDALKGEELTSLPVEGFDFIPTNDADQGSNVKARGTIFLISKTGFMQAIREKP